MIMRNGERGFALLLVLVLLGLGALLVTPSLRFSSVTLKSKAIHSEVLMEQYARDGAAEYAIWQLQYGTVTSELTTEGQESSFTVTLNGITPNGTIKLRAMPQEGGVTLATDDVIRPTKTVTPNDHAFSFQTYTYTITLEQVSTDNSQGLDVVYDIIAEKFRKCAEAGNSYYVLGSSYVDGVSVPDPTCDDTSANEPILRWPATGVFSSDPLDSNYYNGIRDFQVSEKKVLTFQYYARLDNNEFHCNWVILKPWNTLSGKQAQIKVGTPPPSKPGCSEHESVDVSKTSDPSFIQPNVETIVTYVVSISNTGDDGVDVERVTDYLPPGFLYCSSPAPDPAPPAGGVTDPGCQMPSGEITLHPDLFLENVNGVDRWRVRWDCQVDFQCTGAGDPNEIDLKKGETRTFTFTARTTQGVSGNFFNEVLLLTDMEAEDAFSAIGLTDADFGGSVASWNTGTVTVPAYDIKAEGESTFGQGNVVLEASGAVLDGWNIENK